MPIDEFWHGDIRLLKAYQIAYQRDKSYTAWLNGAKIFEAASKAVYNGNRSKQSDPVLQYDDWKDPVETKQKVEITRDNLEQEFRQSQKNQNAWLRSILNK